METYFYIRLNPFIKWICCCLIYVKKHSINDSYEWRSRQRRAYQKYEIVLHKSEGSVANDDDDDDDDDGMWAYSYWRQ